MKASAWPDGRQEDVAAGLVGLGLEREADVVLLVLDVAGEEVERLGVAGQRVARVLGRGRLHALAAAPEHVDRGAELGGDVDVAHRLLDRVPADLRVVRREGAVLEHRVVEEVRRRHRADQSGLVEGRLEDLELGAPLRLGRTERHQVIVVEADAVDAEVGQALEHVDDLDLGTDGLAERITTTISDRPQPERELVLRRGGQVRRHDAPRHSDDPRWKCCRCQHMAVHGCDTTRLLQRFSTFL